MVLGVAGPLLLRHQLGDTKFLAVCRDFFNVYRFTSSLVDGIHKLGTRLLTYHNDEYFGLRNNPPAKFPHPHNPVDQPQIQAKKVSNQAEVVAEVHTPPV